MVIRLFGVVQIRYSKLWTLTVCVGAETGRGASLRACNVIRGDSGWGVPELCAQWPRSAQRNSPRHPEPPWQQSTLGHCTPCWDDGVCAFYFLLILKSTNVNLDNKWALCVWCFRAIPLHYALWPQEMPPSHLRWPATNPWTLRTRMRCSTKWLAWHEISSFSCTFAKDILNSC